jgi:hypothetical protein
VTGGKASIFDPKVIRKRLQRFRRRLYLSRRPPAQVFSEIYQKNTWGDGESVSGPGSRLDRTDKVRAALPSLLARYECHSMLDIPCGDYNWMKTLDLEIDYLGADIVSELVKLDQEKYARRNRKFVVMDLLHDPIPRVDLILCRDCLVHFSHANIMTALGNIKASGSKYLLTTTFPQRPQNPNIVTGEWRPVNLMTSPFHMPAPLELVDDSYDSPNYFDKYLGLWKIPDLPGL